MVALGKIWPIYYLGNNIFFLLILVQIISTKCFFDLSLYRDEISC